MGNSRMRALLALGLVSAVNTLNFYDRQILAAVAEPIRKEWGLSDLQIGWLGTAFILLYAAAGIPLGRLADIWRRTRILAFGLASWSFLTSASGLSRGFWSFFSLRLGIGIGEAACAPACISMIGDQFRPSERARALSVYMFGLPLGIALSYLISGSLAQHYGWRLAYILAGVPGLLLAPLVALLPEPQRGSSEPVSIGGARRPGSSYLLVLRIPTMWWIIASGALHNFNLYALSFFLPSLLIRYHKATIEGAGLTSAAVIGIVGGAGMVLGGWIGDRLSRHSRHGRLLLAAITQLLSVPATYLALAQPPGGTVVFLLFLGLAWMLMYAYYSNVYSTIQDILEPSVRGTGIALYFFAMYTLGAFLGPVATGWASDVLAVRAGAQAGVIAVPGSPIAEEFRAIGLHQAMYMVPSLGVFLAAVLFAGCLTLGKDIENLCQWQKQFES